MGAVSGYRGRCLMLVLISASFLGTADGGSQRDNYPIERRSERLRIFEKAPRGTTVYVVEMTSLIDVTQHRLVRMNLAGSDQQLFRLSQSNVLKVDQHPWLKEPVGHTYHVTIEVEAMNEDRNLLAALQLEIIVSKRNVYAPVFDHFSDTAEVFRLAAPGTVVGHVTSTDADEEAYNRERTYGLTAISSLPVQVFTGNGTLVTTGVLKNLPQQVQMQLTVTDSGSPRLSGFLNVTLYTRETSEPQRVNLQIVNATTGRLCWYKPRYGRVRKYEILYGLNRRPLQADRKTVQRNSGERQCLKLTGLQSRMEHVLYIKARNRQEEGVSTKMVFQMDNSLCNNRCGDKKCLLIPEEPGFQCLCPDMDNTWCDSPDTCDVTSCSVADDARCSCPEGDTSCLTRCRLSKLDCRHGGAAEIINGNALCLCVDGYYGASCEHYNPCTNIQCAHGGICKNISRTEYQCTCPDGYFGETCDRFDPCISDPCLNGGFCRNVSDFTFVCSCNFGYFGSTCQRYDPCSAGPCQNNGMCKNTSDTSYECFCRTGFLGYDCELYNPCLNEPCLHGGMCNSVDGEFFCDCSRARFGRLCEHINLCTLLKPCGEHGVTCHNLSDSAYKCVCQPGWSGVNCTQYDPCFDTPCLNMGTCRPKPDGYSCQCPSIHHGSHCELTNHCVSAPCKNHAICVNDDDGFHCACADGYYGDKCEHMNPCIKNTCVNGATCLNVSATAYECLCTAGYFGLECQHFNSCFTNPCKKGDCAMMPNGKHKCQCPLGYFGPECQYFDPCASSPCLNGGVCDSLSDDGLECTCSVHFFGDRCEHYDSCHSNPCEAGTCHNSPGTDFYCACPLGRFGRTCASRDPCADDPCLHGGSCRLIGRQHYTCECAKGYDGSNCENYNPCTKLPCANGGTCDYTSDGRFTCRCTAEHQGETCEEEVPCHHTVGKKCYNDGTCHYHSNGSFYCLCEHGYFGARCESFDPCTTTGACYNGGKCVTRPHGLFRCDCDPGFFGERCEHFNPCHHSRCRNNATCVQTGRGDVCICAHGFAGEYCEEDLNDCWPDLCRNGGTCIDLPGSFRCRCTNGFTGVSCQETVRCQLNVTFEASGTYRWPSIDVGLQASMECVRTPGKFATRLCWLSDDGVAIWDMPDVGECEVAILTPTIARDALSPFAESAHVYDTSRQVEAAVQVMEASLAFAYEDQKVATDVVDTVDKLLTLPADLLSPNNATGRILAIVDSLLSHITWLEGNLTLHRDTFEVRVVRMRRSEENIVFSPNNGNADSELTVPAEMCNSMSGERLKLTYFNNSKLFLTPGTTWHDVGHVISASVGMRSLNHLTKCVRLGMTVPKDSRHSRCVYWDQRGLYWSPEGVITLSFKDGHAMCCATHLTHFATVTDPSVSAISLVREDTPVLLASHSGTALSILCISVVLFTYGVFRTLNRENLGQAVIQLSISLLLHEACILIGFSRGQLGVHPLCVGVAILSHFFTLSSLLWAGVTAQHVYVVLVKEFAAQESLFLLKRCVFAWGLPLLAVGLSVGLDISGYDTDPESCHITVSNPYVYYSTYIGPMVVLLVVNALLCGLIIRASWRTDYHRRNTASVQTTQVIGVLGILSLLGLTWLMGYFTTLSYTRRYATYIIYVYFTLHGILGLCHFLTFFALRSEARATWRVCCKGKGLSSRRRVAGKNTVNNAPGTVKETNYRLVKDKPNNGPIPPEQERILKAEARNARLPSQSGGVGYDYSITDASASRINHYRILPDTESYPSSPVRGIRKQDKPAVVQSPLRIGEDWVTNTRV